MKDWISEGLLIILGLILLGMLLFNSDGNLMDSVKDLLIESNQVEISE